MAINGYNVKSMENMKYAEILQANRELETRGTGIPYSVALLGNIMVPQLKGILEYALRSSGVHAEVTLGNYDNIVQDSLGFSGTRAFVVFWELANVVEGGQHALDSMAAQDHDALENRLRGEIDLLLSNGKQVPLIVINKFSALVFSRYDVVDGRMTDLAKRLNDYLSQKQTANVRLVDIDRILAQVSVPRSVDFRYFYSSKALYTVEFLKCYAESIRPFFLSASGKARKALLLDCDNTLWGGIIGEDGFDGVQMSPSTTKGAIFREVQAIIKGLGKQGVILGLCSKNNQSDVAAVLRNHPDMLLREDDLLISKVNWDDKVSNLRAIASELNIGTDSLVFLDDSPYEADLVRKYMPEVAVFQVPKALHEYPDMMRRVRRLFFNLEGTKEDERKTQMYKQQMSRETDRHKFADLDTYLKSLGLKIKITADDESLIPRVSQLTQKTNQFNLTTRRYTSGEIEHFVKGSEAMVLTFDASDRYGEYGVTGLCIVLLGPGNVARIDTFLMSCRVIGRRIEYAFLNCIVDSLRLHGVQVLEATYVPTLKNQQVQGLYEAFGFSLVAESDNAKRYRMDLSGYMPHDVNFIEVTCAG